MSYSYSYSNSKSSLEEVEETLKSSRTPDLSRNIQIANCCSLSEASVNIHLHELQDRGKAIRLGSKWVHLEVAKTLEVWQLRRILEELDRKHDQASKLQQRLERKLESRKEYLREVKEDLREDQFRRQQKEVVEIEGSRNYYTRKKEQLRRDKMKVFSLIKEANSKETSKEEPLVKEVPIAT